MLPSGSSDPTRLAPLSGFGWAILGSLWNGRGLCGLAPRRDCPFHPPHPVSGCGARLCCSDPSAKFLWRRRVLPATLPAGARTFLPTPSSWVWGDHRVYSTTSSHQSPGSPIYRPAGSHAGEDDESRNDETPEPNSAPDHEGP